MKNLTLIKYLQITINRQIMEDMKLQSILITKVTLLKNKLHLHRTIASLLLTNFLLINKLILKIPTMKLAKISHSLVIIIYILINIQTLSSIEIKIMNNLTQIINLFLKLKYLSRIIILMNPIIHKNHLLILRVIKQALQDLIPLLQLITLQIHIM
jgi:hypothetical protein